MSPLYVNNAGLTILSPFLGMLFNRCGLTADETFKNSRAQSKAIQLLDYAATGRSNSGEPELVLQKILCGVPLQNPITISEEISEDHITIVDSLLVAVTQQWPGMENTTVDSLRGSFLIREGKLEEMENSVQLEVEPKSYDILMDRIPWNISSIKLSWMPKLLETEWR